MDRCDVLIVGGGPGGSSAAWGLRGSGLDVLILDKKIFPREKVCAGWVTPPVLAALEIDAADYRKTRVFEPVKGFRVGIVGCREIEASWGGRDVSFGIRRYEFDHYLLQRCGARLRLGEPFASMRRDGRDWIVNDAIRARLVVGAGGHFCPVARRFAEPSAPAARESLVVAQEIEFPTSDLQSADFSVRADLPELYFCEDLRGYGWVFRKGAYLNVGIGRADEKELTPHVRSILRWMKLMGKVPKDMPDTFKGHAYLLNPHGSRRISHDSVLLVGDSAGLAHPKSGEGIRPAVESGLLAAKAIRAARADYSNLSLEYEAMVRERFGSRARADSSAAYVPELIRRWAGRRIFSNPWFVKNVVVKRWFLQDDRPPAGLSV